jgi:hypothetical protein
VFGPAGIWETILRRGNGFLESCWTREPSEERKYRVQDFWDSHFSFEVFRECFASDCDRFTLLIVNEGLIEKQELVGMYYEADGSAGDDLVGT